jgi:hypothetical protein
MPKITSLATVKNAMSKDPKKNILQIEKRTKTVQEKFNEADVIQTGNTPNAPRCNLLALTDIRGNVQVNIDGYDPDLLKVLNSFNEMPHITWDSEESSIKKLIVTHPVTNEQYVEFTDTKSGAMLNDFSQFVNNYEQEIKQKNDSRIGGEDIRLASTTLKVKMLMLMYQEKLINTLESNNSKLIVNGNALKQHQSDIMKWDVNDKSLEKNLKKKVVPKTSFIMKSHTEKWNDDKTSKKKRTRKNTINIVDDNTFVVEQNQIDEIHVANNNQLAPPTILPLDDNNNNGTIPTQPNVNEMINCLEMLLIPNDIDSINPNQWNNNIINVNDPIDPSIMELVDQMEVNDFTSYLQNTYNIDMNNNNNINENYLQLSSPPPPQNQNDLSPTFPIGTDNNVYTQELNNNDQYQIVSSPTQSDDNVRVKRTRTTTVKKTIKKEEHFTISKKDLAKKKSQMAILFSPFEFDN